MGLHSNAQVQRLDAGVGSRAEAVPPKSISIANNVAVPDKARARPVMLSVVCAVALVAAIAAGTSILLLDLRDRALANAERELRNTALILAEQSDRAFQTLEFIQKSVVEQI